MIVYDDRARTVRGVDAYRDWRARLDALGARPHCYDSLLTALIETGIFESACADAACPSEERTTPLLERLRSTSEALGTGVALAWRGDAEQARLEVDRALTLASGVDAAAVAGTLRVSVPEGYAFYGLYPESYADAVGKWADAVRPARVLCVGIRSIGTSLSAAAVGALRLRCIPVRSWTIRPHGHPFDRRVRVARHLLTDLDTRGIVLIVDEGPGLSGSSFAAAAEVFSDAGVPDERIVLVPSWNADAARFVSERARTRWARHTAVTPDFAAVRSALAAADIVPAGAADLSAGAWRESLHVPHPWPAVQPQHERRKYLDPGRGSVTRFAGLGASGAAALDRAALLADAGWTAPPAGLARGFLRQAFVRGGPLRPGDVSPEFLAHAAGYVAWLRRHTSTDARAATSPLVEMLRVNAHELLGDGAAPAVEALARTADGFDEPATAIDGRLLPHEWLSVGGDRPWMKMDALDHHCDHFLPGRTDSAWDVAGMLVEFALDERGRGAFVDEYGRRSRDRAIGHRLPFFLAAYAAFRAGYCALAAQTQAGTDDGRRFAELYKRYRAVLVAATLAPSAA